MLNADFTGPTPNPSTWGNWIRAFALDGTAVPEPRNRGDTAVSRIHKRSGLIPANISNSLNNLFRNFRLTTQRNEIKVVQSKVRMRASGSIDLGHCQTFRDRKRIATLQVRTLESDMRTDRLRRC